MGVTCSAYGTPRCASMPSLPEQDGEGPHPLRCGPWSIRSSSTYAWIFRLDFFQRPAERMIASWKPASDMLIRMRATARRMTSADEMR